ncbi:hypothetical protein [Streptomyces sp. NPDC017988]|uniref:hypothetical protein n=1 Tax=Streptomyces sp. NPDC017988 TaxID=3365025 RepID=UPI0037B0FD63
MGGVWTGVRERVLALRSAPYRKAVFGAEFHEYGHGFALLPALTREQVAAVERHRGVTFPAEYRSGVRRHTAGRGTVPSRPSRLGPARGRAP